MTILTKILAQKRIDNKTISAKLPVRSAAVVPFLPALEGKHLAIIAEIKRASPSKGIIHADVDVVAQAVAYERAGASAISVLTDTPFFHGTMTDLQRVKEAVALPVLNKDFIIERRQIDVAYAYGADIILLIVAALDDATLADLYAYAQSLSLSILVEVHDEAELRRAEAINAAIIGVNNRDLHDFSVDITRSEQLKNKMTTPAYFIAESGIHTEADAHYVASIGANGALIGEALMRSEDPKQLLSRLKVPYAH